MQIPDYPVLFTALYANVLQATKQAQSVARHQAYVAARQHQTMLKAQARAVLKAQAKAKGRAKAPKDPGLACSVCAKGKRRCDGERLRGATCTRTHAHPRHNKRNTVFIWF